MNIIDVTLSKLALASYMFDALMPYNKSYQRFNKRVSTHPDLLNESHRKALIEWLNDWGCRHLSKNQHETTSTHILTWFNNNQPQLASISNPVWDLSEKEGKPEEQEIRGLNPIIANAIGMLLDKEIGGILSF